MKVILKQDVKSLGKKGDLVKRLDVMQEISFFQRDLQLKLIQVQ